MQLRPGSEALLVCCGGLQYSPGHATLCRSFLQPDSTPEPLPKARPADCCGGCFGVAQGQVFQIRIHMSTAHWGRFELRLCPLSDPSLTTENMEFNEACLAAHQLYLAPNATQPGADGKVTFLPPIQCMQRQALRRTSCTWRSTPCSQVQIRRTPHNLSPICREGKHTKIGFATRQLHPTNKGPAPHPPLAPQPLLSHVLQACWTRSTGPMLHHI